MISTDGGGGLIPCSYEDNPECKFGEYLKSEEYKKDRKEMEEKNN